MAQPAKDTLPTKDDQSTAAPTWHLLPNSPRASSRTDDIWFFDALTGWLVNSSGYVCKTEDAGNTWQLKYFLYPNLPSKPYLRCMSWANRQIGWFGAVTGASGGALDYPSSYIRTLLHHTRDGGETWEAVQNLPEGSPAGICGFHAVNERVVYGSGTNDPGLPGPSVIKSTDGGQSWELIDMQPYADNLIDIYFFNENEGFVVGGKIDPDAVNQHPEAYPPPRLSRYAQLMPVVLHTDDGGKNWTNTAAGTSGFDVGEWGWKIQFLNEKVGVVALENFANAAILRTTDGGRSWVRHAVQDKDGNIINNDLEGIGFIDENRGWVGGWGNNFQGFMNSYTEDGGKTWVRQDHVANDPASDPRVRINRYRLFTDPLSGGYCSGLQVYRLGDGPNPSPKKAAFAKTSAFADSSERLEPAHGGEGMTGKKAAFAAQSRDRVVDLGIDEFDLRCEPTEIGKIRISYHLPTGARNVFLGLWNQFAFHVRTLVNSDVKRDEKRREPRAETSDEQAHGRQSVIWDGLDDAGQAAGSGLFICRMCTEGERGASVMIHLPQSA